MAVDRRGGRSRFAVLGAVAVLALAPALASCSDGGGTNGGGTSSSAPPTAAAAPADPVAAKAEITRNWTAFFDPRTPVDEKVRLLENGERLKPVLGAFASDKNATMTSAKVTGIEFTSATGADVTYDLLVGGTPALTGSRGTSILQNDTWKVSVKTLCGLVELSGVTVPGC